MVTRTWCECEGYVPTIIQKSYKKTKIKRHLSHIGRQQGLQFLDDEQTQGANWVEQLLESRLADYHLWFKKKKKKKQFPFTVHLKVHFCSLILTWVLLAVPSSVLSVSFLVTRWGSFSSSSLWTAQSPKTIQVSPVFCVNTSSCIKGEQWPVFVLIQKPT